MPASVTEYIVLLRFRRPRSRRLFRRRRSVSRKVEGLANDEWRLDVIGPLLKDAAGAGRAVVGDQGQELREAFLLIKEGLGFAALVVDEVVTAVG